MYVSTFIAMGGRAFGYGVVVLLIIINSASCNQCIEDSVYPQAHSSDCRMFVACENGEIIVHVCPEDQLFHPESNRCRPKEEVDCKNNNNPGSSLAPVPTSSTVILETENSTSTTATSTFTVNEPPTSTTESSTPTPVGSTTTSTTETISTTPTALIKTTEILITTVEPLLPNTTESSTKPTSDTSTPTLTTTETTTMTTDPDVSTDSSTVSTVVTSTTTPTGTNVTSVTTISETPAEASDSTTPSIATKNITTTITEIITPNSTTVTSTTTTNEIPTTTTDSVPQIPTNSTMTSISESSTTTPTSVITTTEITTVTVEPLSEIQNKTTTTSTTETYTITPTSKSVSTTNTKTEMPTQSVYTCMNDAEHTVYNIPDTDSCTYFITCKYGVPTKHKCPKTWQYNRLTENCQPTPVPFCPNITITAPVPPKCGRNDHFTYPDREDCHYSWVCTNGDVKHDRCPEGTLYDMALKKCTKEDEVKICAEQYTPACDPLNPQPYYLPNVVSCLSYYLCDKGAIIQMSCPEEESFSPTESKCMSREEAKCPYY